MASSRDEYNLIMYWQGKEIQFNVDVEVVDVVMLMSMLIALYTCTLGVRSQG